MLHALTSSDDLNAGGRPAVPDSSFVAPGAHLIGDVRLGERVSIWFNTVCRADADRITIGDGSNVQDLSMLHCDPGVPLSIGRGVVIGHKALVHGCTIEDDCLIGMGAIVMNKARIGRGSIIGAGAVVLEGFSCEPYSLVVGSPAKVKKVYDASILDRIRKNADSYARRAEYYRASMQTRCVAAGEHKQRPATLLGLCAIAVGVTISVLGVLRRAAT
jgi:carbonic anhydrase/acetyltransferase-like protein (isoleucine patch superfamily)